FQAEDGIRDLTVTGVQTCALPICKIGVPSEIITKPAPLSDEEMELMKKHPEIGERIIAPVAFLQSLRPIIAACHERWDGNGYPKIGRASCRERGRSRVAGGGGRRR